MGKYLKKFSTDSARVEYEGSNDYIEPYVSYVEGDNSVHYNKVETKLIAYYDIQDISAPTTIFTYYDSSVKSIDIDGKETISEFSQGDITYQFDSVGQHIIKYEFNNPTIVGDNAPIFYSLTTVKRVVIPNTFTAINPNAFHTCSGLTSVTIGNGVTSIGESAFQCCSGLTNVTIGNSVASIGDYAFRECVGLTEITIPNSVTSIGYQAFYYCNSLTSITIPSSVTSISSAAFSITEALKILNYDAQCEPTSLFRSDWLNLETVIIGDSTPSIGNSAFSNCSGLTSVTIGNGVTSIGYNAFQRCTSLASVTIGSGVTSMGEDAFYGCRGLTSIIIPNSVTSIASAAFMNCTSLTSVTIPSSVTNIGGQSFSGCSSFTSVTVEATTPPTLGGGNAFNDTNNCPIYVPSASVETYKSASIWSTYASRIQAIPTT